MICIVTVNCTYCSIASSVAASVVSVFRFDEPSMPMWASFQCPACQRWQTHGLNQRTLRGLRETCEGQAQEYMFRFHALNRIIKADKVRVRPLSQTSIDRMIWRVKHEAEFEEDLRNFFELMTESETFARLLDQVRPE